MEQLRRGRFGCIIHNEYTINLPGGKKSMKKIVKLLAILLLTLTTCIAGGCFTPGGNSSSSSSISNSSSESSSEDSSESSSEDSSESSSEDSSESSSEDSSESSSEDEVVFEGFAEDEITLLVGDKQKLEVEYGGLNKPASFKSSDYSVVAVDTATGTVTAKKAGEATITITYGNYTDTIVVNTTFGELIPVLALKNPIAEETVNINEEVDVSVQVVFNENTFTASNVTYEIEKSDGTLATNAEATITNGKFIAKKEDFERRFAQYKCNCSREYIGGMLVTLGRVQLEDIVRTEGAVKVHCHYCNTDYAFYGEDVRKLFEENDDKTE